MGKVGHRGSLDRHDSDKRLREADEGRVASDAPWNTSCRRASSAEADHNEKAVAVRNTAGAAYQHWMRAQMAYDMANLDFADAVAGSVQEPDLLVLASKVARLQDAERLARDAARAERHLLAAGARKAITLWPTTLI
jgi:hypothetical protein